MNELTYRVKLNDISSCDGKRKWNVSHLASPNVGLTKALMLTNEGKLVKRNFNGQGLYLFRTGVSICQNVGKLCFV